MCSSTLYPCIIYNDNVTKTSDLKILLSSSGVSILPGSCSWEVVWLQVYIYVYIPVCVIYIIYLCVIYIYIIPMCDIYIPVLCVIYIYIYLCV